MYIKYITMKVRRNNSKNWSCTNYFLNGLLVVPGQCKVFGGFFGSGFWILGVGWGGLSIGVCASILIINWEIFPAWIHLTIGGNRNWILYKRPWICKRSNRMQRSWQLRSSHWGAHIHGSMIVNNFVTFWGPISLLVHWLHVPSYHWLTLRMGQSDGNEWGRGTNTWTSYYYCVPPVNYTVKSRLYT